MQRQVGMRAALALMAGIIPVFIAGGCAQQPSPAPIVFATLPPLGAPSEVAPTNADAAALTPSASLTAGPPPATPDTSDLPTPDEALIVSSAAAALAADLGIGMADISHVSTMPTEWSDTSLGCPQPGQAYAQMVTPGYIITLMGNSTTYEVHTDQAGTAIVCTATASGDSADASADPIVQDFIAGAKAQLSAQLGIPETEIALVRSEAREWSDSSLGCAGGQTPTPAPTTGYRIVLAVGEERYEFHTDQSRMFLCNNPTE